ncbi:MAG: peroxidase-related enzyme [Acidimicrobiia bacterium]|nr:peroxidase-related enzyme [Acidimicrobiia bacterium]MBA3984957.1 peroxidase-related enzyme [Acidimicrobiia bacterium]
MSTAEQLPADITERIDEVREKSGFVPNVFTSLAERPGLFRAFFEFHDLVMDKDTPALSKADRELIVVATSAVNSCTYCVVAHGAVLRIRDKDPEIADLVAVDPGKAPLDERRRAIVNYSVRLARTPELIGPGDADTLRDAGLTEDDIWDVVAIVGFFALSNRLAHAFDMRPNPEFFTMGR